MPNYPYNSTQAGSRTKGADLVNEAFQRWRDSQIMQRRIEEQQQMMQIPPMFEHYKAGGPEQGADPRMASGQGSARQRKKGPGGPGGQAEAVSGPQPSFQNQDPAAVALQVMSLIGPTAQ